MDVEGFRARAAVDGGEMGVYAARPKGGGPRPGLLVFMEAFGVNAHIRSVVDRWAAEGFFAAAPDLYHRFAPGFEGSYTEREPALANLAKLTVEGLEADVRAAHAWLSSQDGVEAPLSCVGYCLGGKVSFLAAATVPLKAAVSYYGGGIPAILDRAPRVGAPLLLIWGGQDKGIPPAQIAQVIDGLRAHGKRHVSAEFSSAEHGFNCDVRASYHPAASKQAWALASAFLRQP